LRFDVQYRLLESADQVGQMSFPGSTVKRDEMSRWRSRTQMSFD
jgi:hypothetical protein